MLGNTDALTRGFSNLAEFRRAPIPFMEDVRQTRGDLVRVRLGLKPFYFCSDPDLARHILKDQSEKYRKCRYIFEQMEPIIGRNALVRLEGERWHSYRKRTQQFFQPSRMDFFLSHVRRAAEENIDELQEAAALEQVLDLVPWLMRVVLVAAGRMLFSMDLEPVSRELVREFMAMNVLCGQGIRNVFNLPFAIPSARNRALKRHHARIHALIKEVFESTPEPESAEANIVGFFRRDLRLFRQADRTVDQMIAFLYPAFETTSSSLCWASACVARESEWQERAALEVQTEFSGAEKWPTLLAIYKEALRLYPPAWILAREPLVSDRLNDDWVAPGTTVFINLREIHRHPDHWEEPDKFDPKRFLDGNEEGRHPFAFLPFGGGPRICSGTALGTAEAVIVLGRVLRDFRLRPESDARLEVEEWITQRPRGGVRVRLSRR